MLYPLYNVVIKWKGCEKMAYLEYETDEIGCFNVTSHMKNSPERKANGKKNYPSLRFNGKVVRANKLIYEECFGEVPEGHVLALRCMNHRCINPEHFEVITKEEAANRMLSRREKDMNEEMPDGWKRLVKFHAQTTPDIFDLACMFHVYPRQIKKILDE